MKPASKSAPLLWLHRRPETVSFALHPCSRQIVVAKARDTGTTSFLFLLFAPWDQPIFTSAAVGPLGASQTW